MNFATVCTGIGAPELAWHPLGWQPQWFSEIEPFPCRVLKHYYPHIPNFGDMTKLRENEGFKASTIDLLAGGTPCQSFSVAGLRGGLGDGRGNLALEFCRLLIAKKPDWFVWENVPGVFSSRTGTNRDFGNILRAFRECGYSCAYRVLDAQYCGVPQRRRRVFVIGYIGDDWRPPAAVLFEQKSSTGNIEAGRKTGQVVAALTSNGVGTCGADDNQAQGGHLIPCFWDGGQTSQTIDAVMYKGQTMPEKNRVPFIMQPYTLHGTDGTANVVTPTETHSVLRNRPPGGFDNNTQTIIHHAHSVRKLTPLECERLQGFPDHYTNIPGAKDSPRYKALGNSMAVPVMHWIGARIDKMDKFLKNQK